MYVITVREPCSHTVMNDFWLTVTVNTSGWIPEYQLYYQVIKWSLFLLYLFLFVFVLTCLFLYTCKTEVQFVERKKITKGGRIPALIHEPQRSCML